MDARNRLAVAVVGLLTLVGTSAQAQHRDALVFQDGGQVQMGEIDVDCFSGTGPIGCDPNGEAGNVFEAELEESGVSPGLIGLAEEPGFFAIPDGGEAALPFGDNLPGNAAHSVNFLGAPSSLALGTSILFWDGTGPVSWTAAPNGEYFDIEGNNGTGGLLSGASVLTGIELDSTGSNGLFDTHPDFTLFGNGGTADPTVGFYAIFGQTNIAGLTPSDKWGVVFDFGVENETLHEMAVDSVAAAIPEPGTAVLMGLGLMGLGLRGRRQPAR